MALNPLCSTSFKLESNVYAITIESIRSSWRIYLVLVDLDKTQKKSRESRSNLNQGKILPAWPTWNLHETVFLSLLQLIRSSRDFIKKDFGRWLEWSLLLVRIFAIVISHKIVKFVFCKKKSFSNKLWKMLRERSPRSMITCCCEWNRKKNAKSNYQWREKKQRRLANTFCNIKFI